MSFRLIDPPRVYNSYVLNSSINPRDWCIPCDSEKLSKVILKELRVYEMELKYSHTYIGQHKRNGHKLSNCPRMLSDMRGRARNSTGTTEFIIIHTKVLALKHRQAQQKSFCLAPQVTAPNKD